MTDAELKRAIHGIISAFGYHDSVINDVNVTGEGVLKIIARVQEHYEEKWRLHSEGVKLIKQDERAKTIDAVLAAVQTVPEWTPHTSGSRWMQTDKVKEAIRGVSDESGS